jgi:hypothetical protein
VAAKGFNKVRGVGRARKGVGRQTQKTIKVGEYTYAGGAAKHFDKVIKHGKHSGEVRRPFMRSPLHIQEIISTGKSSPDIFIKDSRRFNVPGTFRGSQGTWELVIDLKQKVIYHYNFTGAK